MEIIFAGILGLFIGSFLGVLADRLPREENVLWGRSHCDYCKKSLRWFELVPVFSFVFQRGRCLRCHKRLSIQYPIVELVTGLGFAFLFSMFHNSIVQYVGYLIIFSSFLVLFIADLKYQILPDSMIIIGSIAAVGLLFFSPAPFVTFPPHILSAAGGFAFLYVIWAVTRGRGMGFGDVKLAVFMGLFLGFPDIIIAFYTAFLTGAGVGVILILTGKKGWKSKIAFGPFLILGAMVAFFWGPQIMNWWYTYI